MKIKKIVEILCVAAFLFTVGCSPADNSLSSDSVPSKPDVNTVYEEIPQYPKYSDVDMQGYTVYYFDSEAGDDDNDGLSKQSPKRTADAAARRLRARLCACARRRRAASHSPTMRT